MILNLKCKSCGKVQTVSLSELEKQNLYSCVNCYTHMSFPDCTRITNLADLNSFEVVGTQEGRNSSPYRERIFEREMQSLEGVYQESGSEQKLKIRNIIYYVCSIIENNKTEEIKDLYENLHEHYEQIFKIRQKENQEIFDGLLGLSDDKTNLEELIDYVESKLSGKNLSDTEKSMLTAIYKRHKDIDFLMECVEISYEQYVEYDEQDNVISESLKTFIQKIGGIAYNKSRSLVEQKLRYILSCGDKYINNWKKDEAKSVLIRYVICLYQHEYTDEAIADNLDDEILPLTNEMSDWDEWIDAVKEKIAVFDE